MFDIKAAIQKQIDTYSKKKQNFRALTQEVTNDVRYEILKKKSTYIQDKQNFPTLTEQITSDERNEILNKKSTYIQDKQNFRALTEVINYSKRGTIDNQTNGYRIKKDFFPTLTEQITSDERGDIDSQIKKYEKNTPNGGVEGFVRTLGKDIGNGLLGPLGFGVEDFTNRGRLANKIKGRAIQSVQQSARAESQRAVNRLLRRNRTVENTNSSDKSKFKDALIEYFNTEDSDRYFSLIDDVRYNNLGGTLDTDSKYSTAKNELENNTDGFYNFVGLLRPIQSSDNNHLIKFHLTNESSKSIIFRMANFTSMVDSLAVDQTPIKYIGRAEALPMYGGVSRNISFNFSTFIVNELDEVQIYNRLNELMGLAYPYKYTNDSIIQPNVLKLSIGSYLEEVPFFLTNLTYASDDELVFSNGKPRGINVQVQGTLIQSTKNPQFYSDKSLTINNFISNSTPQ